MSADHVFDVNPEALRMSDHGIVMHLTTAETHNQLIHALCKHAINCH